MIKFARHPTTPRTAIFDPPLRDRCFCGCPKPSFRGGTALWTFAADTPLYVTELVAKDGVAGNWMWWSMAFGGMLTVFFFADLWLDLI